MTREKLTKIHDVAIALEAETSDILDLYDLKEDITAGALFKGEQTTDGKMAGYTSLIKLPGMENIAEATAEFLKKQIDEVIKEKSKAVNEQLAELGAKPASTRERKAKTPRKAEI